jgi:Flp pilus assembly protein TadC
MPDALDLLTICVEAGLSFDGAMAKVAEKWNNEVSKAFARVIQEVQLGKLRREALRDMQENVGVSEMTSFVAALIQSEQLGVSMAKVLRVQADQMRVRRRQLAEEEAHKAPIEDAYPDGVHHVPFHPDHSVGSGRVANHAIRIIWRVTSIVVKCKCERALFSA